MQQKQKTIQTVFRGACLNATALAQCVVVVRDVAREIVQSVSCVWRYVAHRSLPVVRRCLRVVLCCSHAVARAAGIVAVDLPAGGMAQKRRESRSLSSKALVMIRVLSSQDCSAS